MVQSRDPAHGRALADLKARARAAEQARLALHATAKGRVRGRAETYAACDRAAAVFHAALAAAYPPGFWAAVGENGEELGRGDPAATELAVLFLEADPWFFRSGYVKADLIRRLKRLALSPSIAERLRQVVLAAVDGRDRREFRHYCRLARRVATPELVAALAERRGSPDPGVRRRSAWVLAALDRRGPAATP
jgi:hypothetical protein